MRVPESLVGLMDQGIIEEVIRPLMSGKEARVYLVAAQGRECVAKVYKDSAHRSFKNRADYTEGRRTRSSRDQRAMHRGSRYGRAQAEAQWRTAEADIIFRLHGAGVIVPEPMAYVEEVLLMELVCDAAGHPAPRLADVTLTPQQSRDAFELLVRNVQLMLCAGVVHGDLSEFNVLVGAQGPVIIDFPQAVDPAQNNNARKLLLRDVANLRRFLGRRATSLHKSQHAPEMWDLYERGELTTETILSGSFKPKDTPTDTMSLLEEIEAMERENREKRIALGLPPVRPARRPQPLEANHVESAPSGDEDRNRKSRRRRRRRGNKKEETKRPSAATAEAPQPVARSRKDERRPRRRRPEQKAKVSAPKKEETRRPSAATAGAPQPAARSRKDERRPRRRQPEQKAKVSAPSAPKSKRPGRRKASGPPVVETVRLPPK